MATEIYMPKNGMDMTEGTLIRWLKKIGDPVEKGEAIMEIETDKVTMETEAPESGILLATLFDEGAVVPVLTTVGYIGEKGEAVPVAGQETVPAAAAEIAPAVEEATAAQVAALENGARVAATPCAKRIAKEKGVDLTTVQPTGRRGEIRKRDVEAAVQRGPKATHLAQAMAEKLGVDLAGVTGTGTAGKITKADILATQAAAAPATAPAKAQKAAAPAEGIPMSGMRKVIARRMSASHTEIPPVTQCTKVDVTELLALREKINKNREKADKISINDMVIKAVAKAIMKFDRFRMSLEGDYFVLHDQINIGVAVGLDEGLLVPVIRDVDKKSVDQISHEAKELARKAKNGTLTPAEMGDGRITISNLGMFGTYCFTPIVNQPEAAIVGVCSVEDELALIDGEISVRKKMMICVTYDHRIINGMESSLFQCEVRDLLQNPIEILL